MLNVWAVGGTLERIAPPKKKSHFSCATCLTKGKVTQNGVDYMYTMRVSDNLEIIRHIFSVYAKGKSEGEFTSPHIFNFISFGKYFLFIRRDRRNKYQVCGRLPFHVQWVLDRSNSDYLCYFECKCFSRARTQFYILAQRLMTFNYVEKKDKCPVLHRIM